MIISVVDRHRFDADRDPDRHQNDANPHAYPNQCFTHVGKAEFFKIILFTAMPVFHFLISVIGVIIVSIFDCMLRCPGKKYKKPFLWIRIR